MAIKVILLDIDGTLTNSKKEITPKTKEALLKAQANGVVLVLASGRTQNGLKRYGEELDMYNNNGLFICCNGAEVVNVQTKEKIFKQCLSIEDGKAILEHLKKFDVVPMVASGEYMYTNDVFNNTIPFRGQPFNVMQYESRSNGYLLCEKKDLSAWCNEELPKILTFADPDYLQEHYKEMAEPFGHLSSMFTAPFYYEFTATGVDKTKAIKESLVKLGYSKDEMIAFGDAQNDKSMVEFAGIGVAMGNAVDELKAVADEVTASNEEDGIALSLYKHLPEIFN